MGEQSPKPGNTPTGAVFLSYASQDAEAARRICDALRTAGIEVWFDQSELRGGDAWDRQIRKQIHDCALFIPLISQHSQERLEGYFRLEWKLAVDRSHRMAAERSFIVPVVVDSTRERDALVPDSFRDVQWTHLPGGEASRAFVARVAALLSASATVATTNRPNPAIASTPPAQTRKRPALWITLGLAALAIVVGGGWFALQHFGLHRHAEAGMSAQSQPAVTEKSIAVLPFVDLSEKHDQEYFADGMAEEVINLLANTPGLKVIGRTSSFQFKGKNEDLRTIGESLGVNYVVEGSVRKSSDRIRVTAQLINARDGSHLWSHTYEEGISDSLNVQDQIASSLARALQVTADSESRRASFKSAEAYDLFLRGRHAYEKFDKEGLESAAAYFRQVLDLEPTSAEAAAWLARAQIDSALFEYDVEPGGFERARVSAQHALSLDPKAYRAYLSLAWIHMIHDWDWAAAERDVKQAVRLKPRDPDTLYGMASVDATLGRWDDSAHLVETALGLDPLSPEYHVTLGNVRFVTGRLQEAETEARKTLQISPTYGEGHFGLGAVLLAEGKFQAGLDEMRQEETDAGRNAGLAMAYHSLGRRAESDDALAKLIKEHAQDDAYEVATVYAYRRELDQAFTWLERAYSQRDAGLWLIKQDGTLKNLWSDPRYKAFLRKMNLPE
jgi:TolB-like protein/Flp pilus assembly protein TadD